MVSGGIAEGSRARVIAFYLPQFHPIPENDAWWGPGFTEWTNTAKARPLFRGHYQPHIPADLGFYDLRLPETRVAQAEMARRYGVEGFCYYHYWFGGKQLLERPFQEVLASGEPDFPFCLCWANETWSGVWHGLDKRVLIEQTYPGMEDHRRHFEEVLLPAFSDRRHVTVDGRPLFLVYKPVFLPDARRVTELWRDLAVRNGLPELHLVGVNDDAHWPHREFGFDGSTKPKVPLLKDWAPWSSPLRKVRYRLRRARGVPTIYDYEDGLAGLVEPVHEGLENYPCVIPNWDNTPRSGPRGLVLTEATPARFAGQVRRAVEVLEGLPAQRRLLFVKSWNEWAEGNHLEPDLASGHGFLEALRAGVVAS